MALFAYIDGTTGGMALQVLLGSIAGGLVVFKLAAKAFFSKFGRRARDDGAESSPDATVDDASR